MAQTTTHLLEVKKKGSLSMAAARLVVLRGPDKGRALRLEREEVVVGTADSVDLKLTDPTVSRNHLALRVLSDGYLLSDLESKNGTLVEGLRVHAVVAAPPVEIHLGATRLRLETVRGRSIDLRLSDADRFGRLIGRSVPMRRLFAELEVAAKGDATVLLLGETGTGKDGAAEAIHENSGRAKGPFVVVDCSAIAPSLIESELFGHEKGAFTGAEAQRKGAFEEATGGTLFLDEIGELPVALQTRLLGALERREVKRVGGAKPVAVDVRVIAATNRDLKLEVNRGRFREDLFFRLNVLTIRVPPLREHPDDIPLLAERFRRELTDDPHGELPEALLTEFLSHSWPGNVRELRNLVERSLVQEIEGHRPPVEESYLAAKARVVDAFERSFLSALLVRAGGNVSEAARLAKMNRVHLSKLLRTYGLGRSSEG